MVEMFVCSNASSIFVCVVNKLHRPCFLSSGDCRRRLQHVPPAAGRRKMAGEFYRIVRQCLTTNNIKMSVSSVNS